MIPGKARIRLRNKEEIRRNKKLKIKKERKKKNAKQSLLYRRKETACTVAAFCSKLAARSIGGISIGAKKMSPGLIFIIYSLFDFSVLSDLIRFVHK